MFHSSNEEDFSSFYLCTKLRPCMTINLSITYTYRFIYLHFQLTSIQPPGYLPNYSHIYLLYLHIYQSTFLSIYISTYSYLPTYWAIFVPIPYLSTYLLIHPLIYLPITVYTYLCAFFGKHVYFCVWVFYDAFFPHRKRQHNGHRFPSLPALRLPACQCNVRAQAAVLHACHCKHRRHIKY